MPVNEILAPYYLKVKYNTLVARHLCHMYFETGAVLSDPPLLAPNDWGIQGVSSLVVTPISTLVWEIFHRVRAGLNSGTIVEEIQIWQGGAGVTNFIGSNVVSPTAIGASATGIASAYDMEVLQSPDRSKFRISFFEWLDSRPQRYSASQPPTIDDGTVGWYFLKGAVPFATNDGKRLSQIISSNVGYNRRLARRYGRQVTP